MTARVAIVGGGVSGLATAYYLARAGLRPILIEKSPRLGGLIRTDHWQGCDLEAGPDSYLAAKSAPAELAEELGALGEQIIGSNDRGRKVFIVRHGRLTPLPAGMSMMVPGNWKAAFRSDLFGVGTKLRFLGELRKRPCHRTEDVSIAQFVKDHFGQEMLDYVADPLLTGVYGGDSSQLSAASVIPRFTEYEERFGSLIRAVRQSKSRGPQAALFGSFEGGMQSLTDSLGAALEGKATIVHEEVTSLERKVEGWRVGTRGQAITVDRLVLACPAYVSAQLLQSASAGLAEELAAIPYSSAHLVTLVFRAGDVTKALGGAGILIPQRERKTIAAVTWINSKFPVRVAEGLVALRAFIVRDEAIRLQRASDEELVRLTRADLERFVEFNAPPCFSKVDRWPASMPQYVVGHGARRKKIHEQSVELGRLHMAGNSLDGVGIPDCINLARKVAASITSSITN